MEREVKEIKVLKIEVGKEPRVITMKDNLESFQAQVGGYIECVYPFDEEVVLIVDEEGKINGKDLNRALRDENGNIYDIVAGDFLIAGITEDSFGSLNDEMIRVFAERFKYPEVFISMSGRIRAYPVTD